tara:strand:- start:693 stop:809 length:117 start_codon:yes stop_codon:yes gene_type:complete
MSARYLSHKWRIFDEEKCSQALFFSISPSFLNISFFKG